MNFVNKVYFNLEFNIIGTQIKNVDFCGISLIKFICG